jgi:hypothetical protein
MPTRKSQDLKRSNELSRIGSKGGKRSLETMTPEQRTARAKKAAAASAAKRKKPKPKRVFG